MRFFPGIGDDDARRIGAETRGALEGERVGVAHVGDGRGEPVRRREAVVHVEDHVAAARERERHDPVGVLREDAERSAVDVEDHGRRGRAVGDVDVEEVLFAVLSVVAHVPVHGDAVALGAGQRVERSDARGAVEKALHERRAEGPAGARDEPLHHSEV